MMKWRGGATEAHAPEQQIRLQLVAPRMRLYLCAMSPYTAYSPFRVTRKVRVTQSAHHHLTRFRFGPTREIFEAQTSFVFSSDHGEHAGIIAETRFLFGFQEPIVLFSMPGQARGEVQGTRVWLRFSDVGRLPNPGDGYGLEGAGVEYVYRAQSFYCRSWRAQGV